MAKLVPFPLDFVRPGGLRRRAFGAIAAALSAFALAGCHDSPFHSIDIAGISPPLAFTMTRANDDKPVTEADYRGKITLLYFGYTFCPDVCPTTLANIADIVRKLGPEAKQVRVLFVTVDPDRDTLPVLANYVQSFGPEVEALRGTPDELAALARRYRVVYSVEPATKEQPYQVTHSSVVYVFDGSGAARLLIPSLPGAKPDLTGATADLKRLIEESHRRSLLTQLKSLV
ncbi:MAG: SCO family protein [Methylovirgula sp.]